MRVWCHGREVMRNCVEQCWHWRGIGLTGRDGDARSGGSSWEALCTRKCLLSLSYTSESDFPMVMPQGVNSTIILYAISVHNLGTVFVCKEGLWNGVAVEVEKSVARLLGWARGGKVGGERRGD